MTQPVCLVSGTGDGTGAAIAPVFGGQLSGRVPGAHLNLPEGPTVKVYAIDAIMIEKLLALSDRARNEPRDLYDHRQFGDH